MKIYVLLFLTALSAAAVALPGQFHGQPVAIHVEGPPVGHFGFDSVEEEKLPYSFAWKSFRHYDGLPDKEHIEERGVDGITRGVYRYVDPRHQIQEVVYHSDDSGFHVDASNLPRDTPSVDAAKNRHHQLFEKIRHEHEQVAREHEAARAAAPPPPPTQHRFVQHQQTRPHHAAAPRHPEPAIQNLHYDVDAPFLPRPTKAVSSARDKHLYLFEKIKNSHQQLGHERRAQGYRPEQDQSRCNEHGVCRY